MILNLTQHPATEEQILAGVIDLTGDDLAELKSLLTFDEIPSGKDMYDRSRHMVNIALRNMADAVMLGGAPFFMSQLELSMFEFGIETLYAFSRRESVEETLPDGTVRKTAVFRHVGFVRT